MKGRVLIERIPGPLAPLYEKATRMVVERYYGKVAEEIVSHLKEGRVLDLGTGPGHLPIEIAKRAPHIRLDGIDLSGRLIRTARQNASRAGLGDRLNFRKGNAASLRFQDASYDMVISTGMLHMLRDPARVFRECYRVLKPGGQAWIYDPAQVSSLIDVQAWKDSLSPLERVFCSLLKVYSLLNPGRSYKRDEIKALIEKTGFVEYWIHEEGKEIKIILRK